jgi:penicillin-binding protein 1A
MGLFDDTFRVLGLPPSTVLPTLRHVGATRLADVRTLGARIGGRVTVRTRALLTGALVLAVLASVRLAGVLVYYTMAFPDPMVLRKQEKAPVIRIVASDGTLLTERGQAYDYVPIDLLPQHVVNALVATEDRRFFDHWGVDPSGLLRAAFANLRAGRYAQGGSTLTQQLAKNLFLSSERRLGRKLEEFLLALWLEVRLSKHDILELYLNRVYFGGGAYGIEAAARRYFDKGAQDLTIGEGAVLAGLLKAPSKYSPTSSAQLALARARVVLGKMKAAGLLTAEAEAQALRTPIQFQEMRGTREAAGLEYAIDFVLERLPQLAGSDFREVIVETTVDARLQRAAQGAAMRLIGAEGSAAHADQAGVIVLDPSGAIRAIVGGRNFAESQFNRAMKARRQPGSAFKPFVFLAALENGARPETTVFDVPVAINGWSPRNENGAHQGAMTLRDALAYSVNTIAVRLFTDNGSRRTIDAARRLGIHSELRDSPSLALGTSEVTLGELTGAYAAFANGGFRVDPHIIRSVVTSGGRQLYRRPEKPAQLAMAAEHVGAMNDMLNAALVMGTGRRAALLKHPAAGKTGTSQDHRDAWFIGYTGHFVTGVWVGNDNGQAMNRVMGGTLPARIWREVMSVAHDGLAPRALPGTELPPPPPPPLPKIAADRIEPSVWSRLVRPRERVVVSRPVAPTGRQDAVVSEPAKPALPPVTGLQAGFGGAGFRQAVEAMQHNRRARPDGMMALGAPQ